MTEPLLIDRVAGSESWLAVLGRVGALLGGGLLTGALLVAAISQDLDREQQVQCAFLIPVGAIAFGWGALRLGDIPNLLFDGPILRLDEHGVWLRIGSAREKAAAQFPWSAVDSVLVGPLPATAVEPAPDPDVVVLRFVVPDESQIQYDQLTAQDLLLATMLGVSPLAGALTMVLGDATKERVPEVLGWMAANRPDIPLGDTRNGRQD